MKYAIRRKMFQIMFERNKTYPPMKMEWTTCSETSAYKIQTPGDLARRKHTTFQTRQKFEIKKDLCYHVRCYLLKFSRFMTEIYDWHLRSTPNIMVFVKYIFCYVTHAIEAFKDLSVYSEIFIHFISTLLHYLCLVDADRRCRDVISSDAAIFAWLE